MSAASAHPAIDPERIAVGGDSAGGNLAAVCALDARDNGGPALAAQLLVYPVVDDDLGRPSYEECAEGLLLETADMGWFWNHYCPDETLRRSWRTTPINADRHDDLPPAVMMIADLDPLRSENEAYVERLRADGVEVDVVHFPDLTHGAFGMSDNCEAVRTANLRASRRIAAHLGLADGEPPRQIERYGRTLKKLHLGCNRLRSVAAMLPCTTRLTHLCLEVSELCRVGLHAYLL